MFDGDLTSLSTTDLLESAAEHRAEENRCAVRRLEHAQIFADRHHPDLCPARPGRRSFDGRERAIVLGGHGCPEIAEFAVAEFGLVVGISSGAAAGYIGQALALRHRFPFMWAKVQSGEATPWRAGRIADACLKLSEEAARYVDKRVAGLVDSITPYRLEKIVNAAKAHADPEGARAEADEKARERGVFVGRTDQHGTKTMYVRAPSGGVIRFNASIASIADALKTLGDTRNLDHRRADAVGIMADPRYMIELLLQAHEHSLRHPTPDTTPTPTPTPPAPADPTSGPADHPADPASGPADHSAELASAPADHSADARSGSEPAIAPGCGGQGRAAADPGTGPNWGDEGLRDDCANAGGEPGVDDEADRDAPHPSTSDLPDPLDAPFREPVEPIDLHQRIDPGRCDDGEEGEPLDAAAMRALNARLAQIRHDAHTQPTTHGRANDAGSAAGRLRPGKTEIYVHLTDHTLATGTGVLRVEDLGPLLASQLSELVGHGPYVVKPVIDLNDAVSVDAYEIPDRIRERVKLMYPVELSPYGTRETHPAMDLDHIEPYDALGPPGQTSTENLAPLGRFPHRLKTHGRGWNVRRLDRKTLEWSTPNGFTFHVGPTGTHRVPKPLPGD
ncbi:uncharacterized protein DUF222 [Kribbella steppae]|uniref:Uncharacterized protein DUF222 n=1 Tax=Kribbella steppae TaxID=2512223 RepID=A0A4R2H791_9ACTN|nr:DUF222 domain-containing protein [Kribbella steppae]TCO21244.1 uncharacterized protein DUF222 [Kribbella steppae]